VFVISNSIAFPLAAPATLSFAAASDTSPTVMPVVLAAPKFNRYEINADEERPAPRMRMDGIN
jgi:hypothetical protein